MVKSDDRSKKVGEKSKKMDKREYKERTYVSPIDRTHACLLPLVASDASTNVPAGKERLSTETPLR